MVATGRITSQGQISIPVMMRKQLGIKIPSGVFISILDSKIVIEPVKDLLELGGALNDKAIKNRSIGKIIELEKKAVRDQMIKKYVR